MKGLKRAAVVVAGNGIAILVYAVLFASPAMLENKYYLVGVLPLAVVLVIFGLANYAYAVKYEAMWKERQKGADVELPVPPITNETAIALLAGMGLIALAFVITAVWLSINGA
ncbi:hypothetical protein [Xanthomonas perforans]|uniref:hypothetical protein n=1 Tax=Xanthomonas perforans TaxID=442694 RepID=UPI00235A3036|nr:hypothetical protein [Xanthomonas perforans]MDC9654386.1 hypothetical protein [Xanthomonas perforans]